MKGTLYKKKQPEGWYVVYDIDGFIQTEIPLYPELTSNALSGYEDGKEVDFIFHEVWKEVDGETKVTRFAKLKEPCSMKGDLPLLATEVQELDLSKVAKKESFDKIKQLAESLWEGCDGCDESDKNFWINGFIKGVYYTMGFNQISDSDIEKSSHTVMMNYLTDGNPEGDFKHSTIGADDNRRWWVSGVKWLRDMNLDSVNNQKN